MIVIATHNGENVLPNLLGDIKSFNIPNDNVCIVDNASDSTHQLDFLNTIKDDGYNILYNDVSGYEVGAFKSAIDHFTSDVWFCLQDSLRLRENIFEMVEDKLTNNNVYTLLTFETYIHDGGLYMDFLKRNYNTEYYSKGIFGNNIFAKDSVIQLVKNEWIIPTCKLESEAMERGLSVVFDNHKIDIIGIDKLDRSGRLFGGADLYPFFKKVFSRRQ